MGDFCALMMRNSCFNTAFLVDDCFEDKDHHEQHKDFWINIWKKIPLNIDNMKLESVFNLTVFHCNEYMKFCRSYSEFNGHCVQKIKSFNCSEFMLNDILSIILNRMNIVMNDYEVEMKMLNLLRYNYRNVDIMELSYGMLIQSIYRMIKILDDEMCKNSALNMANIEKYGKVKYSRNYLSKKYIQQKKI